MKTYVVKVNRDAEIDLKKYTDYVRYKLRNLQAVRGIVGDFRETKQSLALIADSIADSDSDALRKRN